MKTIIYSKKFIHNGLTFNVKDITNMQETSALYHATFALYGNVNNIKIKTAKPCVHKYYYDSSKEAIHENLSTAVGYLGSIKEAIEQINYWLTRTDIMTDLTKNPSLKFAGHFTISLKDNITTLTLPLHTHLQVTAEFNTTTTDLQTVANTLLKTIKQIINLVIIETRQYHQYRQYY